MGRYEEAIARLERSLEIFREVGDRWETQLTHLILAYVYLRRGELQKAVQHALTSLDLSRRAEDAQGMGWAHGALAEAYNRQGRLEDALVHGRRSLAYSEQAHDRMYLAVARRILGGIHLRLGDTGQAIEELRGSLRQIDAYRLRHEFVMGTYPGLAEALLVARTDRNEASPLRPIRRLCRRGVGQASKFPNWLGHAYRVAALCEWAADRPRQARRYFQRSIESARALAAEYDLATTYFDWGRFLFQSGDAAAAASLEEARWLFEKCGASFDLQRTESLLEHVLHPPHGEYELQPWRLARDHAPRAVDQLID
jgi:tetratricopeptide (TPR) repeat protein